MKTDCIRITDTLKSRDAAMRETERFCSYYLIIGKKAMHMRLLTEETFSIVHGLFEGFTGDFWIESEHTEKGLLCRICVAADVIVNEVQEEALRKFSTTGKNVAAQGIGGKIRELFRYALQSIGQGIPDQQWQSMKMMYGDGMLYNDSYDMCCWSLSQYLENAGNSGILTAEYRDELERSIIAKLADEVKISITSERAAVIIEKHIPVET